MRSRRSSSRGFSVALVGPDGAGKTTIARLVERASPLRVKSIYMGVNLETSSLMLPTTRLVVAIRRARGAARTDMVASTDPRGSASERRGHAGRATAALKSTLRLGNWLAEEWFRQCVAWYHTKLRHTVVLFDRHFFADYHAYDIASDVPRSLTRRIHGFVLQRLYPLPDLVIYLDAPPEVLFARKGEGTLEWLETRRQDYLRIGELVPRFVVVDAASPVEEVASTVERIIREFSEAESPVPARRRIRSAR
jgi:thymidylate kinase